MRSEHPSARGPGPSAGYSLPAPLLSSRACGWDGIVVELRCASSLDVVLPYPDHVVTVILSGRTTLWRSRGDHVAQCVVRPGDVIITPAGVPTRWQHVDDIVAVVLRLSHAYLDKLAAEIDARREKVEIMDALSVRDAFLQEAAMRFLKALEPGSTSLAQIETLVRSLGLHLLTRYAVKRGRTVVRLTSMPPQKLRRAIDYIEANLHRDLTVADIAEHLSMSESHFSHVFRQTVGMPPRAYVRDRRVERAKTLLRQSGIPITEIANRIGCSSRSHLSVLFHRMTGLTPRQYRALDDSRAAGGQRVHWPSGTSHRTLAPSPLELGSRSAQPFDRES